MSTAAAAPHAHLVEPAESPLTPESWGKLGMWTFLAADAMTFGALLAGYGALRFGDPNWPRPSTILGIPLTAFMTFLLICSSVTMVESLAGMRQGNQAKASRFLALTVLGGICFLLLAPYTLVASVAGWLYFRYRRAGSVRRSTIVPLPWVRGVSAAAHEED